MSPGHANFMGFPESHVICLYHDLLLAFACWSSCAVAKICWN